MSNKPGNDGGAAGWAAFAGMILVIAFAVIYKTSTRESLSADETRSQHTAQDEDMHFREHHEHPEPAHYRHPTWYYGDAPPVAGMSWVTVKNPDPIRNIDRVFWYNDQCVLHERGVIKKLADAPVRNPGDTPHYLVRYSPPVPPGDVGCPEGTLFILDPAELRTWQSWTTVLLDESETGEEVRKPIWTVFEREEIRAILKRLESGS